MNGFTTNQVSAKQDEWVAIFCDSEYFYRAILPAGSELVIARIFAQKIMKEGIKSTRGGRDIPAEELKYCFLSNRTEMITKDDNA